MKKIAGFIIILALVAVFPSCKSKRLPPSGPVIPTATPDVYQNNGRLKSQSFNFYAGMTITVAQDYFYDPSGKIMRIDASYMGYPASTSQTYKYTAAGKVSAVITSGSSIFYSYDANGFITGRITVDGTGATTDSMVFTNNASGLVTRIDETQNGTPSSFRNIIRDASGMIIREDIYAPAGVSPIAYNNYARNDIAKTISTSLDFFGIGSPSTVTLGYEPGGFYLSQSFSVSFGSYSGEWLNFTNTLQSGAFDNGGLTGYYYADKDPFGIFIWMCSASGPSPGTASGF